MNKPEQEQPRAETRLFPQTMTCLFLQNQNIIKVQSTSFLENHPKVSLPSQLHVSPPPASQGPITTLSVWKLRLRASEWRLGRGVERAVVAREVIEHAVRDDEDVFGEVERSSDDEEGEEEEEQRIYGYSKCQFWRIGPSLIGEKKGGRVMNCQASVLNMNFSVGVSMYSENVTSYWYRLRCSQRRRVDGYSIVARRRAEAAARRMTVEMEAESSISK